MTKPMKIDFVSDVSCPWCVIGLKGLEAALARVGDLVDADIRFHPFELNPNMPAEGQNLAEHVGQKYGSTPEQSAGARAMLRDKAAEVGFTIAMNPERRIYNTFDAHRLLHWAATQDRQAALKHALFEAYFTNGQSPGDHEVLVAAAESVGLDPLEARCLLESGAYAPEVRQEEMFWRREGVSAVPTIVINNKYLITGSQPPEAFERALRKIAAES
jgi:predicted DsbA family dithiol-disulfide isomerase